MVDAASKRVEEDYLNTEINSSRNSSLLRGLKRRCLDAGWEEDVDSGAAGRKRSFLETKWESEIQRRRECFFLALSSGYVYLNFFLLTRHRQTSYEQRDGYYDCQEERLPGRI